MPYKPRVLTPDFPVHITGRANNREAFPLPLSELWELFSNYLWFISAVYEIKIHSFVLMPNHFHMIARDPSMKLSEAMNYFMRETSRVMARESRSINRVWGAPYHSSLITSQLYYFHAYKYVYRNPVKANLSTCPLSYRFSTLQTLLGLRRGIIPLAHDETLFSGVAETLKWLDEAPLAQHDEAVQLALRRKAFQFPRDERTKRQNPLADESSVPDRFRKVRAFPEG